MCSNYPELVHKHPTHLYMCCSCLPCATPSYHNLLRPPLEVSTKQPTTTFFVLHWLFRQPAYLSLQHPTTGAFSLPTLSYLGDEWLWVELLF